MSQFSYDAAFERNVGIMTRAEQARLRQSVVAIAGMGGVGGDYLISLVRAGVGAFHLAEFDAFELANFNRQYGAHTKSLGRRKLQVMAEYALEINPELKITLFEDGLSQQNIGAFLDGTNLAIDAMDIFSVDMHPLLVNAATAKGIATVAAVPLGLGAAALVFGSGGMSYQDYFATSDSMSTEQKVIQFALGFAPEMYHLRYVDPTSVDLIARKGPSSIAGCKLCAGLVTTRALTALLHPHELNLVPWYTYIDARLNRFHHRRLWLGNRNPLQRLKASIAASRLAKSKQLTAQPQPPR